VTAGRLPTASVWPLLEYLRAEAAVPPEPPAVVAPVDQLVGEYREWLLGERGLAPGAVEDRAVVRELVGRVVDVAERVRARMDRLGELDLASQDVVIEVVRALQEQLWMVAGRRDRFRPRGA
jgi:hypothetical protein